MKTPFPYQMQYAMNLTNKSSEAVKRINQWVRQNGGSVEHRTTEQIRQEILSRLRK